MLEFLESSRGPVAQESVVDSALLRPLFRPFQTDFLYTTCTQIAGVNPSFIAMEFLYDTTLMTHTQAARFLKTD